MFKNLFKAVVGTVMLPVDAVKDIATLGGAITDERSAIAKRLENIGDNIEKATDPNEGENHD